MREELLNKFKDNEELQNNIRKAINAFKSEDAEEYHSMLEIIKPQLDDYSEEDIIDIMGYFMVQEGYATDDDIEVLKMLF